MAAPVVLIEPHVNVDGVDISDHVTEVHFTAEGEDIDTTTAVAHGDILVAKRARGKISAMVSLVLQQDFDASSIDSLFWGLFHSGENFLVEASPYDDTISETNPLYRATCILLSWNPIDSAVGELMTVTIDMPSNGLFDRFTSPDS